jgi:hypothetical protein
MYVHMYVHTYECMYVHVWKFDNMKLVNMSEHEWIYVGMY